MVVALTRTQTHRQDPTPPPNNQQSRRSSCLLSCGAQERGASLLPEFQHTQTHTHTLKEEEDTHTHNLREEEEKGVEREREREGRAFVFLLCFVFFFPRRCAALTESISFSLCVSRCRCFRRGDCRSRSWMQGCNFFFFFFGAFLLFKFCFSFQS